MTPKHQHLAFGKCRMVGCHYEAAGNPGFAERALMKHLQGTHGIVPEPDPHQDLGGEA